MAIHKLVEGHKYFKQNFFMVHEKELFQSLKNGQDPKILFICCSDSRIVPSLILNAKPGDFFYIRNIGNFIPAYSVDCEHLETSAAVEYAINVLKVEHAIICGHSNCGACASLHNNIEDPNLSHLKKWLQLNDKTKRLSLLSHNNNSTDESLYEITERISILCQIENLLTYPFVKKLVQAQKLYLHGWYYDVSSGELEYYDSDKYEFRPLSEISSYKNPINGVSE